MRTSASTVVLGAVEAVWAIVSDPERALSFMSGVTRWEVVSEEPTGLGARYRMLLRVGSAEVGGLIEIVEWDPPRELAWTSVTGVDQRGRWRLRPAPGGRTRVEIRLAYGVAGSGLAGWLAERITAPVVRGHLETSVRQLSRLVEHERLRDLAVQRRAATGRLTSRRRPRRRRAEHTRPADRRAGAALSARPGRPSPAEHALPGPVGAPAVARAQVTVGVGDRVEQDRRRLPGVDRGQRSRRRLRRAAAVPAAPRTPRGSAPPAPARERWPRAPAPTAPRASPGCARPARTGARAPGAAAPGAVPGATSAFHIASRCSVSNSSATAPQDVPFGDATAVQGHPRDPGGGRDPLQRRRRQPVLGQHVARGVDDVGRDSLRPPVARRLARAARRSLTPAAAPGSAASARLRSDLGRRQTGRLEPAGQRCRVDQRQRVADMDELEQPTDTEAVGAGEHPPGRSTRATSANARSWSAGGSRWCSIVKHTTAEKRPSG